VLEKNALIALRDDEKLALERQTATLATELANERKKTADSITLLNDAENKFMVKLSQPVLETLDKLNSQITIVNEKTTSVGSAAANLVKALQRPEVRGRWGEMALERVFELCGMIEGRDFHKQLTLNGEGGRQRPDYVICIPGGMQLVVDAKAPISAYLEATEAADNCDQEECLKRFVSHVRERVKDLNSKSYYQQFEVSPEFVVLYLPTEAIMTAALRLDADLIEFALRQRVLLAGPTIVMSIVLGVAHGWKQEALASNLREIAEHGKELHKRLSDFCGHLANVGQHLRKSTEAYNSAIGSFDARLMPQARKFELLKVAPSDKQISQIPQIETNPRVIQSLERVHSDSLAGEPSKFDEKDALFQ
jgi:DNA recombination protein RmuC